MEALVPSVIAGRQKLQGYHAASTSDVNATLHEGINILCATGLLQMQVFPQRYLAAQSPQRLFKFAQVVAGSNAREPYTKN